MFLMNVLLDNILMFLILIHSVLKSSDPVVFVLLRQEKVVK
jgi:hypothetical protein